jgi:hypothetical protein
MQVGQALYCLLLAELLYFDIKNMEWSVPNSKQVKFRPASLRQVIKETGHHNDNYQT